MVTERRGHLCPRLLFLALCTIESRSLSLGKLNDLSATLFAGLTVAVIHVELLFKITGLAIAVQEITQSRAALFDGAS